MTVTIAHFSDTHLGYRAHFRLDTAGRNLRALDIEQAYARTIDSILETGGIDLVVQTGEVFQESRPSGWGWVWLITQNQGGAAVNCRVGMSGGNHESCELRRGERGVSGLRNALPLGKFVSGGMGGV